MFLYSLGEKKVVWSNRLLSFIIKLINPTQKYPHITKSYTCSISAYHGVFLLWIF